MTLFLIILSLVVFSFTANVFPKYNKLFILISILIVISFYFFLSKNFFHTDNFYPTKKIHTYMPCGNFYNLLVRNIVTQKKIYIADDKLIPLLKNNDIYENYGIYANKYDEILSLLDTSFYQGKVYLYFGITPVLIFYMPFKLLTGFYLTDKFLVFVLSIFVFLIILILFKLFIKNMKIKSTIYMDILCIFLIGFCSLIPFLLIRSFIYEVVIITANFLLLISILLTYIFFTISNIKKHKYILTFFISLFLCLCVGARPHYCFFIPIFFLLIICFEYKNSINKSNIIKFAIIFLIPCFLYGFIIALYNYLRFDSIFEFGWKYQLNDLNLKQNGYVINFRDFIYALKNNFFLSPTIDDITFFCLTKGQGHTKGNEFIVGCIWTCPIILFLSLIPYFIKQLYKEYSRKIYFILLLISIIFINIFITSCIGMVNRFIFEYLYIMLFMSLFLFYYMYNKIETKQIKNIMSLSFILLFIYMMFINIALLFSANNAIWFEQVDYNNYLKLIHFLF